MHFLALLALTGLAWPTSTWARKTDNAILLSKVKSLTLRDGHETTHQRVDAMPQLTCIGGNAKGLYDVDVMRCENAGSEYDAEDVQWTCKASLPSEFKLGSTDVICEGYANSDDPYVLKGSCGVEYRLVLTQEGEMKYSGHAEKVYQDERAKAKDFRSGEGEGGSDRLAGVLFWIIFAVVVIVILYSIFFSEGNNNRAPANGNRRGYGGGGGGYGYGGGDDDTDPPPPYTPSQPKSKPSSSTGAGLPGYTRPGFWTGAATGAAAGYGAGTWNANRNNRTQVAQPAQGSSWFNRGESTPNRSSSYGSSYGGGSSQASSSRQESTGFGGTSRR